MSEGDFLTRFLLKNNLQEGTQEVRLSSSRVLTVTTGCLTNQLFEEAVGSDLMILAVAARRRKKEECSRTPVAADKKIGLDL